MLDKNIFTNFSATVRTVAAVTVGVASAWGVAAAPARAIGFAVTSVTYGNLVDAPDSTVNGVTYLNQSLPIAGLTANSTDWTFGSYPAPIVTLRRGGYAPTDNFGNYNNRQLLLGERVLTDPATRVRIPQPTTTEAVLSQNNILQGAENVFVNTGFMFGLQSDVERVDFVFATALETSPKLAVPIFERGAITAHDGFQIAPILSIDSAGNPTSYGSLISIAPGWGQINLRPGGGPDDNLPYSELTNSSGALSVVNSVNQQVGGLLLPLSVFSATPTTIYGFSLFAPDVSDRGNSANLLDWKNAAVFPQNTPNEIGGLDLLSGSGQVVKAKAVPEPSSVVGALLFGASMAAFRLKKKGGQSSNPCS